ncbi:hypothetical protein [Candidatus Nitrosotenuis sp. DW1]|uniref:hypothetical protein n=1 Tax=Candidatus Nitrosotenuis sp. DW1 TaxID=2259672 RepID=UPI0015CED42B|nr:hypothetical protein [Candidatus Nitrosotenuis sp. DW1]
MYEKMREVARANGMIFYSDLAAGLGMTFETEADRNVLRDDLADISIFEHSQGRPMLSAVVVHKPTSSEPRMPGKGFFRLAREQGIWDGKGTKEKFFFEEIKKVYEYWSAH